MTSPASSAIPTWRAGSFLVGMLLVWLALCSPLVLYEHELLTVHMIQHLLLMTVAPALILLGQPLLAFGSPIHWPPVQRAGRLLSLPAVCWSVSALTLVGWHVPALFTMALHSQVLHAVEQLSFLCAGLLFWWPVVHPWPSASIEPPWSTIVYLFLATLPCDILSAFLVFSDRVVYPVYLSMPRHVGLSVLEDQQCAGALMWTCITVVYLVPAAILSTRLLSPRRVVEAV